MGLGVVIEGGERALVKLFEEEAVREGEKLLLREAEQLIAYDLQLNLIETYLGGVLTKAEERAFQVFFKNSFRIGEGREEASSCKLLKQARARSGQFVGWPKCPSFVATLMYGIVTCSETWANM
jgi:hypothetical protein